MRKTIYVLAIISIVLIIGSCSKNLKDEPIVDNQPPLSNDLSPLNYSIGTGYNNGLEININDMSLIKFNFKNCINNYFSIKNNNTVEFNNGFCSNYKVENNYFFTIAFKFNLYATKYAGQIEWDTPIYYLPRWNKDNTTGSSGDIYGDSFYIYDYRTSNADLPIGAYRLEITLNGAGTQTAYKIYYKDSNGVVTQPNKFKLSFSGNITGSGKNTYGLYNGFVIPELRINGHSNLASSMSIQYIQDSKTYLSGYISTITPAAE